MRLGVSQTVTALRRVVSGLRRRLVRSADAPDSVEELRARTDSLTAELELLWFRRTQGAERERRAAADLGVTARALAAAAPLDPEIALDEPVTSSAAEASIRFEPSATPVLSVITVAYGHRSVLVEALEQLAAGIEATARPIEVIVLDQLHPELGHGTADVLDHLTSGVRVIRSSSNRGFAGGNNLAVSVARAPAICLLNPDVKLAVGQLEELLDRLDEHPDAIVVPRLVFPDGRTQERGWRVIRDGETRPITDDDTLAADYGSAACWLLRRSTFDAVDGFDEEYHPAYYEDSDFALRAAELGHPTVIADDIAVVHEWSFATRETEPDVSAQRARFVARFADLIAERAGEIRD